MKKLLFSVTKKDFDIQTFRCGGKGGQNVNKRETGVRIIHRASGAIGESREERNQLQNKKIAFKRLLETKEWKTWHKIQTAAMIKGITDVEKKVDELMKEENIKVEYY